MPIQNASDSQKVDYLWKKIAYGATKTDIAGNIDATQEPFPSPLQIRADRILQNSDQIPAIIPGSNTSVVSVYTTSLPIECISDSGIATPTLTWLTGQTFWIPPEFGPTYQVKVYISPSGQAGNVLTKGTQVFATGSGNNDLWVFDYQSGILNFNSNNTPFNASNQPISFTGNSVYISGAVYSGAFGLQTPSNIANIILGNITFSGNTISSNQANGNIMIFAPGQGVVQFVGQDAIGLPSGDDTTRPLYPVVGYTRFNTARQSIEYYDGAQWLAPGEAVISSQTINPDGSANTFSLSSNTTTAGVLVSINGTLQQPTSAYTIVNNNQIQFTEIPLTTDVVEVRYISVGAVTVGSLQFQNTTFVNLDAANVNVTGNVLPSANVTYDLGSPTLRWRTGYFAANTLDLGGSTIGVSATGFSFTAAGSPTPILMSANGAMTSNTLMASTVTVMSTTQSTHSTTGALVIVGGLGVGANLNLAGNLILGSAIYAGATPGISGQVLQTTGSGVQWASADNILSGASNIRVTGNYVNIAILSSNIGAFSNQGLSVSGNVSANYFIGSGQFITALPGYAYSNVNVAAYTQTQSFTNYSNINLSAYLGGTVTVGGNLTVNGNLFVNGNVTTFNANNLTINDSMIYLADDNPADILDIGIVSSFTDSIRYQHTGFVRDASDNIWKLFANVVPEPTTTINFTNAIYGSLQIGNLRVNPASGPTAIFNAGTNGVGNIGESGAAFNTIFATASTALYADLAENYVADFTYAPGTVVEFGGAYEITQCNTDMSSAVAGVVSEKPAYLMNSGQQGTHIVAVALQGRVRARVIGPIRKGNMLVSAGNGLARAENNPQIGSVLGKALENFDGTQGVIEIVVGIR